MSNRSRILIAEDHTLVAELYKRLLESDFDVVGVVSDGRALARAAIELKPDLIVLDIAMPVMNGLDAGRQVKKILPFVKLIYVTMNADTDVASEAFACGASGYLLKTCVAAELVLAVRETLRGKTYLAKAMSRDAADSLAWQHKEPVSEDGRLPDRPFTDRLHEVLPMAAERKVMKEPQETNGQRSGKLSRTG